jgi:ParB family transcriptional regulator, chromosome partitioning protein
MSKKRLTFDIDLPEDETFPAGKVLPEAPARRGPMASAIAENADSLRDRRTLEDQIRAENDALAQEHVRMKKLGLIADLVPLDRIETRKLVRDRSKGDDMELAELITSIREVGLSNPIRLELRDDGQYELIQGYRRLAAYRALLDETGDSEAWGAIPAGILPRGEGIETLYRRMVDENLVRKDISFAEMAQLALTYARDPETAESDPERVVAKLFQSAGYQKRSYIRGFIRLMDRLGEDLRFAAHVPRALGLALSTLIEERPEVVGLIREGLRDFDNRSVADELNVLRRAAGLGAEKDDGIRGKMPEKAPLARPGKAKTTFQVTSRLGAAKCMAANGRLEIRLDRDFSALDRRRLEQALRVMLDNID